MITGNALKISRPNGSDEMLLADAPEGQHDGFWLNIESTITAKEAIVAGSQADVNDYLGHVLGSVLLEDRLAVGPKGQGRQLFDGADGYDLRKIHKFMMRDEVECNLLGAAIDDEADFVVKAKIYVPFSCWWLRGERKRPGHTQVRALFLKVVERNEATFGGAGGAKYARKANTFAHYEVEYDVKPGVDQIAALLTLARATEPRRILTGPAGLTLVAWETTPLATTPLKSFKVKVGSGDRSTLVHDVRSPDVLAAQFNIEHPDADQDLTDDGTPFYFVEEGVDVDDLPHGEVVFEQVNQDLAPINARFLYYPEHDAGQVRDAIGNAAYDRKEPVLASVSAIVSKSASRGAAAVANIILHPANDSKFVSEPGILGLINRTTQTVVPPAATSAATSAVKAVADQGTAVSSGVARRLDKLLSLRIPGATDSNGRGRGSQREEVRQALNPAHRAAN